MTTFEELLELQEFDLRADRLRHRLAVLDERKRLDEIRSELAAFDGETDRIRQQRDEFGRIQKRHEDEAAIIETKAAEIDATLYGGSVTSPRELQALQAELESVRGRQSQIEDQILETMELIDPLDADLTARVDHRAGIMEREAVAAEELEAAERGIRDELTEVEVHREALVPSIPPDLLAHYESLRERLDGVGVAKLTGNTCGGCHLMLSATELDRIRHEPADALVHCEECGRLLVR